MIVFEYKDKGYKDKGYHTITLSHYQHKPTQKSVKQEDGVESQLPLLLRDHLLDEGDRSYDRGNEYTWWTK